ncbi:uncharacterized protein LOC126746079 isoform X2 [Anthonomus grandis grandis]|uniref:uncharacterized protein LOC126746079 isoform X2 n=1 Tax=Anthonomus grandis grandis TaxID=2921223 RepID=UPI00216533E3|nr:uncharacterized protein LOC126746079 isoform X2 [Anthonomus grandis grandis]
MGGSSRVSGALLWGLVILQAGVVVVLGECWYDNKKHEENAEVPTGEPCLNCTCSKSVLLCYLRVCPKLPNPPPLGCILLHRYKTCCPELICSDFIDGGNSIESREGSDMNLDMTSDHQPLYKNACISNGSIYSPGSAMHSSSLCEYCYCLAGKQVCVKPKCLLPIDGCNPVFEENSCCPVRYNCTSLVTEAAPKELTTTTAPLDINVKQDGCSIDGIHHLEGSKVIGMGHSVCDNCYCLRGLLRCEPLSCAPPLLGCAPVIKPGDCCAASYNCKVNPEPNYGLFPTISKQYSKLRKEVHRKPSRKNGVVTVAPFYVLAESLLEPTTKVLHQRSPGTTYGTTRHFSGVNLPVSSTQKSTEDNDDNYFLISSSKLKSTSKKPTSVPGIYYATTNYESHNTNYRRFYSTTLRSKPSTPAAAEAKAEPVDYLGFSGLNLFSIVDSLLDGTIYKRAQEDSMSDSSNVSSEETQVVLNNEQVNSTEADVTTEVTTEFSAESTDNDYSTTVTESDSTIMSTESFEDFVTVTTVLNSTDCIKNIKNGSEFEESTPADPQEINALAETRADITTTITESSSEPSSSTKDMDLADTISRNSVNTKLTPNIEAILNISKQNINGEFDYDYNEPTLPPSLPNLKIIPFVAADALDAQKESSKVISPIFIDKKVDTEPVEYSNSMFKPPVQTEGGFIPKEPPVIEDFYEHMPLNNVPSITTNEPPGKSQALNCISNGKEISHGTPVASDSPCMTCTCFYGNVVCQKSNCPAPKPGCIVALEQGSTLCCPNYICNDQLVPKLPPQEIITVAEGIIPDDPFRDVIRTESAPNLQSLIGDLISHTSSTTEAFTQKTTIKPETTTSSEYDDSYGFDKVLQFIFSGNPDIIEKPLSKNPVKNTSDHSSSPTSTSSTTTFVKVPLIEATTKEATTLKPVTTTTTTNRPIPEEKSNKKSNSIGGILKLAGCNIYGRMYRVGRIISELSGPCLECKCTEVGVQCKELKCKH